MIGVVGGGLSGLLVGLELERRGIPFTIFEASPSLGGVVRSRRVEGRVLDYGPQRTRMIGPVRALIDELDLGERVRLAPPGLGLHVYRKGRLRAVPMGLGALMRSDVVGPAAKLRVLLEPLTRGARPDERVSDYFIRKFGRDLYHTLLGPFFGGLYAADPAQMEVDRVLAPLLDRVGRSLVLGLVRRGWAVSPPPACSFDEGMAVLPRALGHRLAPSIRSSDGVHALHPEGAGWTLESDSGRHRFDQVVVTVPPAPAGRLLETSVPGAGDRVGRLSCNPVAVVHLLASGTPRGMGFQVAFGEGLALRGVTFNDAMFTRTGLHTAYLGGAARPEVVEATDADIADRAVREFAIATGIEPAGVLDVTRVAIPGWDLAWRALDGLALPDGLHLCANWESRPGIPGRIARAVEVAEAVVARLGSASRVVQ